MLKRLIAAAICLSIPTSPALATRVSPMVVNLEPAGRLATGRVEVGNTAQADMPVETLMFRGDIGENGELTLTPADEDFLVFPVQALIPPNGQQVFRVQYVGNPDMAQSEIYYLSVRQIPVVLGPGEPRVQIVSNFNVLVNVIPSSTSSKPVLDWARPAEQDSVRGMEVRLSNQGTRAFSASGLNWRIEGEGPDGAPVLWKPSEQELSNAIGVGVVAPGKSRIFFIPAKEGWKEGSLTVKVD